MLPAVLTFLLSAEQGLPLVTGPSPKRFRHSCDLVPLGGQQIARMRETFRWEKEPVPIFPLALCALLTNRRGLCALLANKTPRFPPNRWLKALTTDADWPKAHTTESPAIRRAAASGSEDQKNDRLLRATAMAAPWEKSACPHFPAGKWGQALFSHGAAMAVARSRRSFFWSSDPLAAARRIAGDSVVCAFGQSASVVSAFSQRFGGNLGVLLAKSAHSPRRLVKSAHNARGKIGTGSFSHRNVSRIRAICWPPRGTKSHECRNRFGDGPVTSGRPCSALSKKVKTAGSKRLQTQLRDPRKFF